MSVVFKNQTAEQNKKIDGLSGKPFFSEGFGIFEIDELFI